MLMTVYLSPCLLLGLAVLPTQSGQEPRELMIIGLFVLWGIFNIIAQGKGYAYQSAPYALFAALWGSMALAELDRKGEGDSRALHLTAVVLALFIPFMIQRFAQHNVLLLIADDTGLGEKIAHDLATVVRPGDRVQVLDDCLGGLDGLLILGVSQPTRFIYDFQLVEGPDTPFRRSADREFIEVLRGAPPKAIVITNQQWPRAKFGYERIETWKDFTALLSDSYRLQFDYKDPHGRDGYRIFVRRS